MFNYPLLKAAYSKIFAPIDKGLLEVFGPTGGGKLTYSIGNLLARLQTGRAYDYAAAILLGLYTATLAIDYEFLLVTFMSLKTLKVNSHTSGGKVSLTLPTVKRIKRALKVFALRALTPSKVYSHGLIVALIVLSYDVAISYFQEHFAPLPISGK